MEHLSGLRAAFKEMERERLAEEQRQREAAEALAAALQRTKDDQERRAAHEAAREAAQRAKEQAEARERERADTQAKLRVSVPLAPSP